MVMSNIPANWANINLDKVIKVKNGYAFPSKFFNEKGILLVRQSNLDGEKISLEKSVYLDEDWLKTKAEFVIRKGDILLGMSGSIGKWCKYNLDQIALQNQRVGKIIPLAVNLVNINYILYGLVFSERQLLSKGKGLGLLNVSTTDIESLEVPFAPLNEQKRIVKKLDKLLAKVDSANERLDKIPAILRKFRQSVLQMATNGDLTHGWRIENDQLNWGEEAILIDLIKEKPRNGLSIKAVPYETSTKTLTLTATTSGKFLPQHYKFLDTIIPKDSHLWLKKDDILIQRSNSLDYVGVSAIYEGVDNCFIYPDLMMKIKAKEGVNPKYLLYHLQSSQTRYYFRNNATGTAGNMPKINQTTVSNTPIIIPSYEEQTEIVKRVEELFNKADQIEARYKKAKQFTDKLSQSILAKAFRGELVPQDPNDEPAEKLLERIREEKEKQKVKNGRRK